MKRFTGFSMRHLPVESRFPKETYKNTYKNRLPWLTNELKQQIKKKNRLYVHSKRNPTQLNIEKYKNTNKKDN